MNSLQQTQVEMLKLIISICEKLNLKYFVVCGTALGAVKYKGFIPWDDDVDIALFREDYEKFLQEAPNMLPKNYFLQNMHTEKAFPLLMTKLRKSDTTFIEKSFAHLPINHGVCVDIFPLDGYPKSKLKQNVFELRKWINNKARCFAYIYGYKLFKLNFILRQDEKMFKKYPCKESEYICNHANWQGKLDYSPIDVYGEGEWAEFEGVRVRIPKKYDEYFTQKYGDWRSDPPADKQESHHIISVCDLDKPYTEYIKEK